MGYKTKLLSTSNICPLITGIPVPIQGKVQGVGGSSIVGFQLQLSECIGSKCRFYLSVSDGCCFPSAAESIILTEELLRNNLSLLKKLLDTLKSQKE